MTWSQQKKCMLECGVIWMFICLLWHSCQKKSCFTKVSIDPNKADIFRARFQQCCECCWDFSQTSFWRFKFSISISTGLDRTHNSSTISFSQRKQMTANKGERLLVKQYTDISFFVVAVTLSFQIFEQSHSLKQSSRVTLIHILAVLLLSCGSLNLNELYHVASCFRTFIICPSSLFFFHLCFRLTRGTATKWSYIKWLCTLRDLCCCFNQSPFLL